MAQDSIDPNTPGLDNSLAFKDTNPHINAQAGTSYSAQLSDIRKLIRFTGASPAVMTIELYSKVPWPNGTVLNVERGGSGSVQIAGASGVTINRPTGFADTIAKQYDIVMAVKTGANTWTLTGGLTAS